MRMRLHIVRGSFSGCGAGDGAGGGQECAAMAMEPAVWSRMPDDLMWRVLVLVPVAKRFQFQAVSHKWRQALTSGPRDMDERVVACVSPAEYTGSTSSTGTGSSSSDSSKVLKVVHMDLSFVPRSFWKSNTYNVVAPGAGLVVISNNSERQHLGQTWARAKPWVDQYCVLNPVTRSAVVLPPVPFLPLRWLPPTPASLTMVGVGAPDADWEVGVYDLTLGSRGVGRNTVVPRPPVTAQPPVARAGGRIFWFWADKVHVLEPGPGGRLVDAGGRPPLDAPSVALLGLDPASWWIYHEGVYLMAHRGAVYFVASVVRQTDGDGGFGALGGLLGISTGDGTKKS